MGLSHHPGWDNISPDVKIGGYSCLKSENNRIYHHTVEGTRESHPSVYEQKQKYRGMFETQKSRNKTSSGDIGLNIRTLASPKVGQDQVSGGVSVLCWHAAPVDLQR